MPSNSQMIGTAGVYFVAAKLSALGLHCAPTLGNAPNVDLLVSSEGGSKAVAMQVKTTCSAVRRRGRGDQRVPEHCEWDIGHKCAMLDSPGLWFALVDLKLPRHEMPDPGDILVNPAPDVYLVRSPDITAWFKKRVLDHDLRGKPILRWRYHPKMDELAGFKNAWGTILTELGVPSDSSD
jgi:hypothetical protein